MLGYLIVLFVGMFFGYVLGVVMASASYSDRLDEMEARHRRLMRP